MEGLTVADAEELRRLEEQRQRDILESEQRRWLAEEERQRLEKERDNLDRMLKDAENKLNQGRPKP